MTATITTPAPTASQTTTSIYEVRGGTDGIGVTLCHVIADSIADAREMAAESLTAMNMSITADRGLFTVHGLRSTSEIPADETLASLVNVPALDWEDFSDLGTEVTLDLPEGTFPALYLADGAEDLILVSVEGTLMEVSASEVRARCECGNPFGLCHPDA